MGDWDYGREHGLWGDDGIPYGLDEDDRDDDGFLDDDDEDDISEQLEWKSKSAWKECFRDIKDGETGYKFDDGITRFHWFQTVNNFEWQWKTENEWREVGREILNYEKENGYKFEDGVIRFNWFQTDIDLGPPFPEEIE